MEPLRCPYRRASLQTLDEGRCVQILHLGRYGAEQPTIERLHRYAGEHGSPSPGGTTRSTSAIRAAPGPGN